MHSVKSSKDPSRYTYRWREWKEVSQEEYERNYKAKGKKNRTRSEKGKLFVEAYCSADLKNIPVFKTKAEADAQKHIFEAKYDARLRERESRETWHDKYYNFEELIKIYETHRKESAKNCYESCFIWFRDYVLQFFLIQKQAVNLEEWRMHFKEFRLWLTDVRGKRHGKVLAYASKNKCINELNYFLNLMWEEGKCDAQPSLKIFSEDLVNNHRGAKHLISDDEFNKVYAELVNYELATGTSSHYSDVYYLLKFSGLRITELTGIGLNNVRSGKIPRQEVSDLMLRNGISEIYSYIFLLDQPSSQERDGNGSIQWKPLKGKKKNDIRSARYIPITDKKAHNILAKYYKEAREQKEKRIWGEESKNYAFFFDHISANGLRYRLKKAYDKLSTDYKSPHLARHTLATYLTRLSQGMNDELAAMILGHKKNSKTIQRYNLLFKEIVEEEINKANAENEFIEYDLEA